MDIKVNNEHNDPEIIILEKLNKKNRKIKKAFHIADIHIPDKTGFDDYIEIFNFLFEKIKKYAIPYDESIIFLCGDLLDQGVFKADPRAFTTLQYLYKGLLEYCDCITIHGNHEFKNSAKFNNPNPLETLVGREFCSHTNTKHINYVLNENANYVYKNLVICPTMMDSNIITKCIVPDKISIGLYHGQLYKCKTDMDFIFEDSCSFRPSDFEKEYDMTFLGDIHKHQYMNKKKTIAYCGSLLQLNAGECVEKGILEWNLLNKTSKFIAIKNNAINRYNLLNEDDIKTLGKIDDIRKIVITTSKNNINNMSKEIRKRYGDMYDKFELKVAPESLRRQTIDIDLTVGGSNIILDIKNKESIIDTVIDFAKKNIKDDNNNSLDDKLLEKIREVITEKSKDIKHNIESDIKNVKIKELKFDNVLIYGEGNMVNFSGMKGVVGITGKNSCGKSSLIDALLISIFGKCTKGDYRDISKLCIPEKLKSKSSKNEKTIPLRVKSPNFKTYIKFSVNNIEYIIERKYISKKDNGHNSQNAQLNFYNETTKEKLFSGKSRDNWINGFDQLIKQYLCSYDDFKMNFFMEQNNDTLNFVKMSGQQRKQELLKIFKVDILTEMSNKILDWEKNIRNDKRNLTAIFNEKGIIIEKTQRNFDKKSIVVSDHINKFKKKLENEQDKKKICEKNKLTKEKNISQHDSLIKQRKKYIEIYGKLDNIDDLIEEKNTIDLKIKELKNKKLLKTLKTMDAKIENIKSVLKGNKKQYKDANKKFQSCNKEHDKQKTEKNKEINAKIMLKKVYDDYIKRYGNELDIKILEDKRKHIKKNIKNLKSENNDVVENTNSLKTLELFIKKHKKQYDNSSKQINKFEKNIEKMKEEKHNLLFSKEKLYIVEYEKKHYNKIIEDHQDDSYRSKFEDLVNKYDSNDIKRKKFIDKIMEISNLMVSSSDNIILAKDQIKKITKNKTIKKSNYNIEKKIIELEEKIKSAEVELVEYNYFIQKYKDTIDEKNKLDNENKDIEIKNGKKELDLEKYNQKLEKLDENIKELKNIDNSEIENIDKNIDKIDKNIIKIEEEINKVENIISEYETNEKDLEDLLIKKKETEFLIKNSDLEISKFENSINKLQIKIQELTELNKDDIIKNIEDEKKEIEDIKKEYDLCVANIALFEEDIKIITRTFDKLNIINEDDILCCLIKKIFDNHVGIAGYLIKEKLIPSIQATTNKVLEEAGFNHEIKFSLDGDKLNMSVNKTKEYVYDIDIKYNSGFEKDMINIIMMYIFTQINTKLRSNFIIIDEPFSSADNSNIENMKNMLLHWKHIFDYIIIISHNSDIKDEYDQSINIINNGNTSKVYYPANKENYKNK
jgi:DNA repair exonuclease SbcCD ATPase subunit